MTVTETQEGMEGRKIGRFAITGTIGAGGMGQVYRAADENTGKTVALKVLLRRNVAQKDWLSAARRLRDEARATAKKPSPYLIKIIDSGEDEFFGPFIAYEFLSGGSLRDLLKKRVKLSTEETISRVAIPLLSGLGELHKNGIVHRDIKPANLICEKGEHFKIGDLGLALYEGREAKTATGAIVGTPGYLAPEILLGRKSDERSDVYAAAMVIVECLSGKLPFKGKGMDLIKEQSGRDISITELISVGVPGNLAAILMPCLSRDPKRRHTKADTLLAQLTSPYSGSSEVTSVATETSVSIKNATKDSDPSSQRSLTPFYLGLACILGLLLIKFYSIPAGNSRASLPPRLKKQLVTLENSLNNLETPSSISKCLRTLASYSKNVGKHPTVARLIEKTPSGPLRLAVHSLLSDNPQRAKVLARQSLDKAIKGDLANYSEILWLLQKSLDNKKLAYAVREGLIAIESLPPHRHNEPWIVFARQRLYQLDALQLLESKQESIAKDLRPTMDLICSATGSPREANPLLLEGKDELEKRGLSINKVKDFESALSKLNSNIEGRRIKCIAKRSEFRKSSDKDLLAMHSKTALLGQELVHDFRKVAFALDLACTHNPLNINLQRSRFFQYCEIAGMQVVDAHYLHLIKAKWEEPFSCWSCCLRSLSSLVCIGKTVASNSNLDNQNSLIEACYSWLEYFDQPDEDLLKLWQKYVGNLVRNTTYAGPITYGLKLELEDKPKEAIELTAGLLEKHLLMFPNPSEMTVAQWRMLTNIIRLRYRLLRDANELDELDTELSIVESFIPDFTGFSANSNGAVSRADDLVLFHRFHLLPEGPRKEKLRPRVQKRFEVTSSLSSYFARLLHKLPVPKRRP